MKIPLLAIGLTFLCSCGNVTTSKSFTPEQRLKNSENELSTVGLAFKASNELTSCESIYKITCQSRLSILNDFISVALAAYGSEETMPVQYQQRTKNVSICIDTLNADLKNSSTSNCNR